MSWPINQFAASFLKPQSRRLAGAAILMVLAVGIFAWNIKRQAQRELDAARMELERNLFVPFERQARPAIAHNGIRLIQSITNVRDLAQFNNSYFAATDGGLVEFDLDGKTLRRYTVLEGLPESDLTCLSSFNSKLFIGTRSQGLVVFDGKRFERYRWPDRHTQAITALLEDRGRLLIGTFAGGLLEFDGNKFKEIKAGPDRQRLKGIGCLVADGHRLFVGAFADGLWINESGRWSHFTIADGLPSNRVVGIVANNENLVVATDFGVAVASTSSAIAQKTFQTVATLPSLTSMIGYRGSILLSKDNGEVFQLASDARSANRFQIVPLAWNRPENLSSCRLTEGNKQTGQQSEQLKGVSLWLLSGHGLWRDSRQDERFSGRIALSAFGNAENLWNPTSNLISALAVDENGRLWAGSFRNGIDIFTADGRKLAHLESESIREINALVWDKTAKRMLAATSQGLIQINSSLQSQQLSKTDGLLSNSILHAALIPKRNAPAISDRLRLALATSRGLSLGDANQWRGLTTVQGLPSNSVYTVLPHREFVFAGTLNGLAQISGGRVARVFKDSNSKLTHNWVTSLCAVGPRLFVGTYGGGVFELTAAGDFVGFASEIGRQTVNPNAMASDGERLYVGTLDGAWVLELRSQKWIHLKSELPSSVVLSVASDERHLYLGATNGIARIEKDRLRSVKEL